MKTLVIAVLLAAFLGFGMYLAISTDSEPQAKPPTKSPFDFLFGGNDSAKPHN